MFSKLKKEYVLNNRNIPINEYGHNQMSVKTYVRDWLFPAEDVVETFTVSSDEHYYYRVYCTTSREEPSMSDYEFDSGYWSDKWHEWEQQKDVVYKRYEIDRATVVTEGASGKRRVTMFSKSEKFPIEDWVICIDQTGQKKLTCRFNDEGDVVHKSILQKETVKLNMTNIKWEKQKTRRDEEYKNRKELDYELNGEIEFILS